MRGATMEADVLLRGPSGRTCADSVRLHECAAHILSSEAFAAPSGRWYCLPSKAGFSGTAYRPKQTYRAPSHNSKTVLSIVKIGPLKRTRTMQSVRFGVEFFDS